MKRGFWVGTIIFILAVAASVYAGESLASGSGDSLASWLLITMAGGLIVAFSWWAKRQSDGQDKLMRIVGLLVYKHNQAYPNERIDWKS